MGTAADPFTVWRKGGVSKRHPVIIDTLLSFCSQLCAQLDRALSVAIASAVELNDRLDTESTSSSSPAVSTPPDTLPRADQLTSAAGQATQSLSERSTSPSPTERSFSEYSDEEMTPVLCAGIPTR